MEKQQDITEIFGFNDPKIKDYLTKHPDVAERLANILISLESQRKKENKNASAVGFLGTWRAGRGQAVFDKEYFHQPKYLYLIAWIITLIFIFTITFLASLFYNI